MKKMITSVSQNQKSYDFVNVFTVLHNILNLCALDLTLSTLHKYYHVCKSANKKRFLEIIVKNKMKSGK